MHNVKLNLTVTLQHKAILLILRSQRKSAAGRGIIHRTRTGSTSVLVAIVRAQLLKREREKLMRQIWSWVRDEETSFNPLSRSPAGNIIFPCPENKSSLTKAK